MQSTTCLPDGVAHAILQEAPLVFHDPRAFHPAPGMVNTDAARRARTMGRVLRWGEGTPRRVFLRLDAGAPVEAKALAAQLLRETTPVGERIARPLRHAFILGLPFIRGTQEAAVTALRDPEAGLERGARLLAAVVCLRVFGSGGALERSLRASMPTRGGCGTPAARVAASLTATSAAFRAGRSLWGAQA
jgi:hypothetical protein